MPGAKRLLALNVGLLVVGCLVLLAGVATPRAILSTLSTMLVFSLPGVFIGMALFGKPVQTRPESLIFGLAIGLALSEFTVLLLAYVVGWSVPILLIGVLLLALAVACATYRYWHRPLLPGPQVWSVGDYGILTGMGMFLVAFLALPFINCGKLTDLGYAFTWLFGFDFILRSSYAASITLGMPPDFLHLTGRPFRYYLVSYTAPAFAYSASGKAASLNSILLIYALWVDLLFLACLYAFLRHFTANRRAMLLTAIVAMGGYSYYSWYVVAKHLVTKLSASWVASATERNLLNFGDVSHLFQRLFLVEPQAVTGLCVVCVILFVLELVQYKIERYAVGALLGLALGIEFGIDALFGLVLIVWLGGYYTLLWLRTRQSVDAEYGPLATSLAVCGAVCLSYFTFGMYSFADRGAMVFDPYRWMFLSWPLYFPLEFGAMLLLGVRGLWRLCRKNPSAVSRPLLLLAVIILAQVIFIRVGVLPRERVAQRLLPLLLLVWTGGFFEDWLAAPRSRRSKILVAGIVLAAVPTVFTDIRFASSVNDPTRTGYVSVADMKACEWIRSSIPPSAILQGEPNYYAHAASAAVGVPPISLIPDFGERREVLGEMYVAESTIVHTEHIVKSRANDLRHMFRAEKIGDVLPMVEKYGIDYLYVGPAEQRLYPGFLGLLQKAPNFFQEVYSNDGVYILKRKVPDPPGQAGESRQAPSLGKSRILLEGMWVEMPVPELRQREGVQSWDATRAAFR